MKLYRKVIGEDRWESSCWLLARLPIGLMTRLPTKPMTRLPTRPIDEAVDEAAKDELERWKRRAAVGC